MYTCLLNSCGLTTSAGCYFGPLSELIIIIIITITNNIRQCINRTVQSRLNLLELEGTTPTPTLTVAVRLDILAAVVASCVTIGRNNNKEPAVKERDRACCEEGEREPAS